MIAAALTRLGGSIGNRLRRGYYRATGRKVIHLIHIGKTGGTAVKDALHPFRVTPRQILVMHSHQTKLRDIPAGDLFFFFLRDPLSRFVSGFYSRQREGRPRRISPWNEHEKDAFGRFTSPNALAKALSSADPNERAAAMRAMRGIRHVKDFYWDWFGDEAALRARHADLLFIGYQESLGRDFDTLRRMLGLPESAALSADPVVSHRNPGNLDYHLDEDARANLLAWYQPDREFMLFCESLRPSAADPTQ